MDGVNGPCLVTAIVAFIVLLNQIIIVLAVCLLAFSHDFMMVGVVDLVLIITSALILTTSLVIVCVLVSVMFVSAVVMLTISLSISIAVVGYLSRSRQKQVQLKYFDRNDINQQRVI